MFRHALKVVACICEENIAAKVDCLKNTFRRSDVEVDIVVSRAPVVLLRSKESLQRRSEFLISELGLESAYVAHRPTLLIDSIEGRMRPRYYVVNFSRQMGCSSATQATILLSRRPRRFSWKILYALTRKLHRTSMNTMPPLAKRKCLRNSYLHERRCENG